MSGPSFGLQDLRPYAEQGVGFVSFKKGFDKDITCHHFLMDQADSDPML